MKKILTYAIIIILVSSILCINAAASLNEEYEDGILVTFILDIPDGMTDDVELTFVCNGTGEPFAIEATASNHYRGSTYVKECGDYSVAGISTFGNSEDSYSFEELTFVVDKSGTIFVRPKIINSSFMEYENETTQNIQSNNDISTNATNKAKTTSDGSANIEDYNDINDSSDFIDNITLKIVIITFVVIVIIIGSLITFYCVRKKRYEYQES